MNLKALCGTDYVRGSDWSPKKRTEKGWELWAKREAAKMSKRDNFKWDGVVCWIQCRNAFRISFAGQKEKW